MEKNVGLIEFSEDEDSAEIIDGCFYDTQWGKMHAIRHPMPKNTLWGSELILGTILDSKKSYSADKLNYRPINKVLFSETSPPPPSSSLQHQPYFERLASVIKQQPTPSQQKVLPPTLRHPFPSLRVEELKKKKKKDQQQQQQQQRQRQQMEGIAIDIDSEYDAEEEVKILAKEKKRQEIRLKMLQLSQKNKMFSYSSSLTEGTMFDLVEKPVWTTVDHFQHEWLGSGNDYSSMRLGRLIKDLNIGDNNDCSDLTCGTYLETVNESHVVPQSIWDDPVAPGSRTQSDMSFTDVSS